MSRKSKVTNMRPETFDHTIADKRYVIKSGESVIMDRHEAVDLCGTYLGPNRLVNLKIEHVPDEDEKPKAAPSPARVFVAFDGKEFPDKAQCENHNRNLKR